jgi:hypothetical protein
MLISDSKLGQVLEILSCLLGYETGRIVITVLSLGNAHSDAIVRARVRRPRWHGIYREPNGEWNVDEDTTRLIGWALWIAVGLTAYFVMR